MYTRPVNKSFPAHCVCIYRHYASISRLRVLIFSIGTKYVVMCDTCILNMHCSIYYAIYSLFFPLNFASHFVQGKKNAPLSLIKNFLPYSFSRAFDDLSQFYSFFNRNAIMKLCVALLKHIWKNFNYGIKYLSNE